VVAQTKGPAGDLTPSCLPVGLRAGHATECPLRFWRQRGYSYLMFTIEHEFDATVITLIDEGSETLEEDVTILAFEECVVLEQEDPISGDVVRISLSMAQLADLAAALDLPEGSYRLENVRKP